MYSVHTPLGRKTQAALPPTYFRNRSFRIQTSPTSCSHEIISATIASYPALPRSTLEEYLLIHYIVEQSLSTLDTPSFWLFTTVLTMESSSPPAKRQRRNTSLTSAHGTNLITRSASFMFSY